MPKLQVIPLNKGLRNDRLAFNIDNDAFPTLINAFQWRSRVRRKRGTSLLCRLQRYLGVTDVSGNLVVTITPAPIDSGIITVKIGTDIFVDAGGASPVNLTTNSAGTAVLNRTTGVLTITGSIPNTAVIYNPTLPAMGLEDYQNPSREFVECLAFDTKYSYQIQTGTPFQAYDVSFYKNPSASATLPSYAPKSIWTRTSWNGQDYQQFFTTNYQGCLWATNGINIPFNTTNIGMQYIGITGISIGAGGPPATITITTSANHGLSVGDFVFLNEINGNTGINFQTGYVTVTPALNQITVVLPNATIGGAYSNGGIVQYLTNRNDTTKDCLRWYDGDPTNGNPNNPTFQQGRGWVNFCPPLSRGTFPTGELPTAQYYLVGARMIVPFKDYLLFLGPVVQTSAAGSQAYLPDTIIYSQNGTPFYTCSFTGDPSAATTVFNPVLVPQGQTATASAFFEDQAGFGGFITAGISQAITTVTSNEDVLLVGFENSKTRVVFSGNNLLPFSFYFISTEYGSSATFSAINMGDGDITLGNRGFVLTTQTNVNRVDLQIPDEVFEVKLSNNGRSRVCAQRDFINEWIYFTYPSNQSNSKFPGITLQYNYRDGSWSQFYESYTTYGLFRKSSGLTWATVGQIYPSWSSWDVPWNAGTNTVFQPDVIAGNQQGFIMIREEGTDEGFSLAIQNIAGSVVTCPNHNLNNGDYIIINNVKGDVGSQVNGKIFSVVNSGINSFTLNPLIDAAVYQGGGEIQRMYVPFIQTRQFPVFWEAARKTRIGAQQYLLTKTDDGEIELLIFLSQNSSSAYNAGGIYPDNNVVNGSLIYSTTLYTCPESLNLGLTQFTKNLQTPTATQQSQIWHRLNTSLIGDTVQLGFTMSDRQMREFAPVTVTTGITGITQATQAVITIDNTFAVGQMISLTDVEGMTEINYNGDQTTIYQIVAATATDITINLDTTSFTAYTGGGNVQIMGLPNQFAEIELHGFIMDVNPSQLLV